MTVKQAYEDWARQIMPKDCPATQIVEMRRSFYSGFGACLVTRPDTLTTETIGAMIDEVSEFFRQEVETGYGLPEKDGG